MAAPEGKTHRPVMTVDYEGIDKESGYGDACYMDVGLSTWNREEFSAKIWRWSENGQRWSRQGEELPFSRVLDLATLVAAIATGKGSVLKEYPQAQDQLESLQSFVNENMRMLGPKMDELRRILQPSVEEVNREGVPNVFSFATSELSQDAIFAWLLSWANPRCARHDRDLHTVAVDFARLLTGERNLVIKSLDVGRQWEHIDVWAEINDDVFLAIEDKTGTSVHDDQLLRYKKVVNAEYPKRRKCFAYVKTGNEPKSILEQVEKAGYRVVLRKDILDCIESYRGDHAILCEYRDHLRRIENDTQSFRALPIADWSWSAWEGFYKELECRKVINDWGYVPNQSGGFLGAYWHFMSSSDCEMYLQFEQEWLCFKICGCENEERSEIRNKYHGILMEKAQGAFPEIVRPSRFGAGEYMTVAKVDCKKLFGADRVEMDFVVKKIRQYEKLVDECVKS